jgi:parvulin-like peptidyl-prolyl isomerase
MSMPLVVNNEIVDNKVIDEEMNRMRAQYEQVFKDQKPAEQEKQLREWAKENVIERILIRQAALNDSRPISKGKINDYFKKMISVGDGQNEYTNLTENETQGIKKDIEIHFRIERLINQVCKDIPNPTQFQAIKYYEKNIEQFTTPEQVRAAHIVIHVDAKTTTKQAKQKIIKIKKQLDSGKRFESLADKLSDCPGNGGDLGYFQKGQMVQNFEDAVFALKKNEISDIIETEFGYHIAKLYDRKPSSPIPFEQVKETIYQQINDENRNARVENYVDELKKKAKITEFVSDLGEKKLGK